jgi:hypothetical protein
VERTDFPPARQDAKGVESVQFHPASHRRTLQRRRTPLDDQSRNQGQGALLNSVNGEVELFYSQVLHHENSRSMRLALFRSVKYS